MLQTKVALHIESITCEIFDALNKAIPQSDASMCAARTLQHVVMQQSEGPETAAHEQNVLLVQGLLGNLQSPCTQTHVIIRSIDDTNCIIPLMMPRAGS